MGAQGRKPSFYTGTYAPETSSTNRFPPLVFLARVSEGQVCGSGKVDRIGHAVNDAILLRFSKRLWCVEH